MPKPRILFAWELGANLGHATVIMKVAAALADCADLFIAARDPDGHLGFCGLCGCFPTHFAYV